MAYNPEATGLEFKVEVAFKKTLIAGGVDESLIVTGESSDDRPLPAVICKCTGGPEEPPGTGNYLLTAEVCVLSNSDKNNDGSDSMVEHRRIVKQVRDILWPSNLDGATFELLHNVLTAQIEDFTAFPEIENEGIETQIRDRKIESSMKFRGLFCETDLTFITPIIPAPIPPPPPPPVTLFTAQLSLPCTSNQTALVCFCGATAETVVTVDAGPTPGQLYEFSVRIRGVMEKKVYFGGANDGAFFQIGGQPNNDSWNVYSAIVSDPPQTYYFNRGDTEPFNTFAVDYLCKIRARAGATIDFKMDSIDGAEGSNHTDKNQVVGITFVGQPFAGQFIQIDTLAVQPVQG